MISIVVPVYNVEKYLSHCLDSLIGQTYRDLEIICVNDGSTDGSQEILERYAEKDKRIIVVNKDNQGPSEARNEGVRHCSGEWLMFVDSDDWLEMNCCDKILPKDNDIDLVVFSYIREFKTSSSPKRFLGNKNRTFKGQELEWLYERFIAPNGNELKYPANLDSLSTVWGKIYKTKIVKDNNIQFISTETTGTLEDLLFNVEYFAYIGKAFYISDSLYHYRKATTGSIAYTYKPDLHEKWQYAFKEFNRCIDANSHTWITDALERREALCLFGLGLNITFSCKSWFEEYRMLNEILTSDWYSNAIALLDTSQMPLHWRCFYGMARKKHATVLLLMLRFINIIINR